MSTTFHVRAAVVGVPESQAAALVAAVQDELRHRPHLQAPAVSWNAINAWVLVSLQYRGREAQRVEDAVGDELMDIIWAVVANPDGWRLDILAIESVP